MQGQKAVVVLIIAMILTAGVGFFANVSQEGSTRTEYSTVGNLDAFMSANSSPTPQSELFNSAYNITGWSGDINTTNTVLPSGRSNQYVFTPEVDDVVPFTLSHDYGMHGYTVSGSYSGSSTHSETYWVSSFFKTSLSDSQNVYLCANSPTLTPGKLYVIDGSVYTEYGPMIGGYGQSTTFENIGGVTIPSHTDTKTLKITFNGTDYSNSGCFIADLNDVFNNTSIWIVTADGNLAYDDEHAPMAYSTVGEATTKEAEYRTLYPDMTWNHRRLAMSDLDDNVRLIISQGNVKFVGDYNAEYNQTITTSGGKWGDKTTTASFDIAGRTSDDIAYLQYRHSTQHWYAYSLSSSSSLWDTDKVGIVTTNGATSFQLQLQMNYVIPAVYFDPTRYMGIEGTATWSNYDLNKTMVNTEITFLWKGTGDIKINGATGPTLKVINVGNTYSIQTNSDTIVPIGTYKGLEITLRASSSIVEIRGIISEQTTDTNIPNTQDYVSSMVSYEVGLYDSNINDKDTPTVPENIYRLIFDSANGYAYIQDTYILTDPNNLLWSNISINLENYFDKYKDGMRILFQGFVRYGNQITINGQDWDIVDSGFSVTVTEIVTPAQGEPGDENYRPPVTRTYDVPFNMNGLAVDYYDGHCRLVQTNGRSTVDLGEIADYVIEMNGVWFFSSSLSTISVIPTKATVWNPGWDMDMNTTLLLFAGCVIFLSVVMMMRFRDMMDWEDIVILICSIVVPLVLVAV